ncbi:MAG: UDP-N-acetylmuramate:L-alanyl-gamma-D-glutamyl-meso-diaminopimelate ligase [Hyphomicrobiales bacterium]
MDMSKNFIPASVRRIHLIAVCGTAMGALACMLKDLGYEVTGSDQKIYPPMSRFLSERGIPIREGFRAEHLAHRPDLVVVGNAVPRTNPEAVECDRLGLPFCSMPQAVNRFVASGKHTLMTVGTHGKTTTSALLAWMLQAAGCAPSFVIGGILANFNSNYRLGNGDVVVIEGDEYDTAFFDKGPKFLHYVPAATVLTSVEFDHADIYRDLEHVKSAFRRLVEGLGAESLLVAFDGDERIDEVIAESRVILRRYGQRPGSDWRLGRIGVDPPWTSVDVFRQGRKFGRFRTRMIGTHNLVNALAVIAVADHLGISAAAAGQALESFEGVKRRQEVRGERRGILVMDDFAHHPTAVRETIAAVKGGYPGRRLIAVFEPRTNSSMRKVFQSVYPRAFDGAEVICIRRPSMLEKIPEGERFSSEDLVADLQRQGKIAAFFPDTESIINFVVDSGRSGDVVLIMSNGGFDNIHERLLAAL